MNKTPFEVWEKRWGALNAALSEYGNWLEKRSDEELARKRTLLSLVISLQAFADSHFHFFYKGFSGQGFKLHQNDDYPAEYVLASILDQVSYDFAAIQLAASQRLKLKDPHHPDKNPLYETQHALELGDKLATAALKPAIDTNVVHENTTVLTYLQKSPFVRVIPYANVALIGVPFSCVDVKSDFLSIPHELGHYIYSRGWEEHKPEDVLLMEQKFIESKNYKYAPRLAYITWLGREKNEQENFAAAKGDFFSGIQNYRYVLQWDNEIFADVYSACIGGPLTALSGQDFWFANSTPKNLFEDDRKHPSPAARPYAYYKVMSFFANRGISEIKNWGNLASKLKIEWEGPERVNIANSKPKLKVYGFWQVNLDTPIGLSVEPDETKPIDKVIQALLKMPLFKDMPITWWGMEQGNSINELYPAFENHLESNSVQDPAELAIGKNDIEEIKAKWDNHWKISWEKIKGEAVNKDADPSDQDVWLDIWRCEGWNTSPDGNPKSK